MAEYDFGPIFDGKESVTFDEFKTALGDVKLADLSTGAYVSKGKYDDELAKAAKRVKELEESAGKAEDSRTELEKLAAELEAVKVSQKEAESKAVRLTREKAVAGKVTNPKLAKLALIEAEALVTDDLDFDAALAKVLADDPEYTDTTDSGDGNPVIVGTGPKAKAGAVTETDPLMQAVAAKVGM